MYQLMMFPLLGAPLSFMDRLRFDKPDDGGAGGDGGGEPAAAEPAADSGGSEPAGGEEPAGDAGGGTDPTPAPTTGDDGLTDKERMHKKREKEMDDLVALTNEKSGDDDSDDENEAGDDTADSADSDQQTDDESERDTDSNEKVEVKKGFDNDTVELDGKEYYYHPDEHGKESGQGTTYTSRDDAEIGFGHKIGRVKELRDKLAELDSDVGAVDLPDWLGDPDNTEAYEKLMDFDYAMELPNEDLREHINEADKLITHLSDREKRVRDKTETKQTQNEVTERASELLDRTEEVVVDLGLDKQLKSFKTNEDLVKAVDNAIDKKVANELEPLVKEYKNLKTDEDKKFDDDYADKLEAKYKEITAKKDELSDKYREEYLSPFNELNELQEKAESVADKKPDGMTEKERVQKQNDAFLGLQDELKDSHPMFMSSNQNGLDRIRRWAVDRAEEFNGLMRVYDWHKAIKAFDSFMEERRAEIRKQEVEEANKGNSNPADDMPEYGDQKKLTDTGRNPDKREKNQSALDELAEETNAKVKAR